MFDQRARVEKYRIPANRRIIAVSDIHGNLPYFKGLLERLSFDSYDELFIVGDFLEKGRYSLETLRFIMELYKNGNVHPILGNCDNWHMIFTPDYPADDMTLSYVLGKKTGLLWDMMNECGIDPFEIESFSGFKERLKGAFKKEWEFLASLPYAIETDKYIFAHAGMSPDKPLEQHSISELTHVDGLMNTGRSFRKWLIVGHWPVMLYGTDRVCANPIIDRQRKIISIDGGCVLKDDGQLNGLIIPNRDSEDFAFDAYDPFPVYRAVDDQKWGGASYYIRWGDSRVQVLERGEEFSRCRHVRTGYEMDILTKYLYSDTELTDCNDCTDYVPRIDAGDTVSLVETTSRGYFVKHKGYSGWYFGRLENIE